MEIIEEATVEAEWDIAEGIELLAGNEIQMDDTQDEQMIHPEAQVIISEHV